MTSAVDVEPAAAHAPAEPVRVSLLVRGVTGGWPARVGLASIVVMFLIAFVGPVVAPHDPTEIVAVPFAPPGDGLPLGADFLGRDALSRFLHGGAIVVIVALLATGLAYVVGISLGLLVGLLRGAADVATLGVADVLVAFPPVILVLMLVAGAGSSTTVAIVAISLVHLPRIVRIVRSVTREVAAREYVEAAIANGEGTGHILRREILPNIWTPVMADFGLRVTGSMLVYASLSFLGLGQDPPASNWGLMISENRIGLLRQPPVVLAPAIAIAVLAIGFNLVADGIARSVGRSTERSDG
jgi:peptide/nickel transport system permease protein